MTVSDPCTTGTRQANGNAAPCPEPGELSSGNWLSDLSWLLAMRFQTLCHSWLRTHGEFTWADTGFACYRLAFSSRRHCRRPTRLKSSPSGTFCGHHKILSRLDNECRSPDGDSLPTPPSATNVTTSTTLSVLMRPKLTHFSLTAWATPRAFDAVSVIDTRGVAHAVNSLLKIEA